MMVKKKEKIAKEVIIAAIIMLGIIEIVAIYLGINGTFRMIITIAIAGLAGYTIQSPFKKTK